ncbi:glutamate-cysteine ligase family protein [Patescibacteria group bacterium AH-259-L07]|nr:glutamate-cysteine ligase family protein [Patescibacteria group bacterium AH-259-L07]
MSIFREKDIFNVNLDEFLKKFKFDAKNKGLIGIEQEYFLVAMHVETYRRIPIPCATIFLREMNNPKWTYELSACQVEVRTHPEEELENICAQLLQNDYRGHAVAQKLGLDLCGFMEVAPKNMLLDISPDPRHVKIAKTISKERLKAACRVAGTHIHIGMPDIKTAIKTANHLRTHLNYLCRLGDHSSGERLRLYKEAAKNWEPPYYRDTDHFFEVAKKQEFADNPRDCYHLIRISIHGTVELRMFGVTDDVEEIMSWIAAVRSLLKRIK